LEAHERKEIGRVIGPAEWYLIEMKRGWRKLATARTEALRAWGAGVEIH
jgi:hypothetical protein